jgi:signal transduction histidine kinase
VNRAGLLLLSLGLGAIWPCAVSTAGAAAVASMNERLKGIQQELESLPKLIPSAQNQQRLGFHGLKADPAWVMIDFGRTVTPERVVIFSARLTVPAGVPSPGFPAAFQIEIADASDFATSIRIAGWKESDPGAGEHVSFLSFEGNRASGRFLRVRVTGFRDDPSQPGQPYFRLGEIVVLEKGQNVALTRPVTSTAGVVSARAWEPRNVTDGYFWCLPLRGRETSPLNGYQSTVRPQPVASGKTWVEVDLGSAVAIDEVHLVPAHPRGRGYADLPGYGFPTHFRVLADPGTDIEKVIRNENNPPYPAAALPNPGAAQVMFATPGLVARRIRVSCEALARRGPVPVDTRMPDQHLLAMSELQCWREGKNLAAGCAVSASDTTTDAGWSPAALTDGHSSRHELLSWTEWLDGLAKSEALQAEARLIRAELQRLAETSARRKLTIAIASAIAIALIAAAVLLIQRTKARRQQDTLRTRIARDLHDEIGASLSHLAMQGDLARQQLQRAELSPDRLEKISASARETLDQMRDIIWLLAPKEGDWQELSHRMEAIARRLLEGVAHQITHHGKPPEGCPAIEYTRDILAFLKEALTNARKHAHATHVGVDFDWSGPLVITIEDNGQGFDMTEAQNRGGSGLDNLQARATAMKATCEIQSTVGKGTVVRLATPLTPQ